MSVQARMTATTTGLDAGSCRVTLTRNEWHLLHHVLRIVQEHPADFGGTEDEPAAARYLGAAVAQIKAKLPPDGAGSY
jgi:hypothetical protein